MMITPGELTPRFLVGPVFSGAGRRLANRTGDSFLAGFPLDSTLGREVRHPAYRTRARLDSLALTTRPTGRLGDGGLV